MKRLSPNPLLRPDWRVLGLVLSLAACSSPTPPGAPAAPTAVAEAGADSIYFGGNIITVNDAQPSAEAVAIKDGKIVAVGSRADVEAARKGANTKMVDLAGKTLSPSFIDPHSHFINSLTLADQANCSAPPVGLASDVPGIIAQLQKFRDERKIPAGELIMGYGYDENLMPDGTALDRTSLDAAFPDNPVMVVHVSLHGVVLNGAAMKKYGLSAATKTPPGGIILRMPGSNEPSGLVMETAFLPIFAQLPSPTPEQEIELLKKGQAIYAAAGVTTAQEGATHASQVASLKRGAQAGAMFIDVVAFPFITDLDAVLSDNPVSSFGTYRNRFKLGGVKITADGSPQGKTAFFTTPYLTGGPSGEKDWKGEPTFPKADLDAMFKKVYDLNLPLLVHANGDAAIDMILEAHAKAAEGTPDRDRRTTVIHSQFVRKDQLQRYVDFRIIPSFYTEHTFFFSGAHLLNRGKQQTHYTSPMRTAISMGLKPTNHTDFSVLPMDQMLVLWSAVNRVARDGEIIGPDERVTPLEALKAITINAAYQNFEEGSKGSIEVGKLADLVILDQNPLTVDPMTIKDIHVVETFKEGKSIYRRPTN